MVTADVAMALDNLASAALSKMDTIDTLVIANKQSTEVLANVTKENETLLDMAKQLITEATKPKP